MNMAPLESDFANADGTQATIPLSPSATPPREVPGYAPAHSAPASRRTNATQPVSDEPVLVGYREHSQGEDVDQPEPGSSRSRSMLPTVKMELPSSGQFSLTTLARLGPPGRKPCRRHHKSRVLQPMPNPA